MCPENVGPTLGGCDVSRVIISAALAVLLAALPARADQLPQGDFMLGAHVWPDILLPRYTTLHIEGDRLDLAFSSPLPLDFEACEESGDCIFETHAASATATLEGGRLTLADVVLDPQARIDPSLKKRSGVSDAEVYTVPLIASIGGARLDETQTGFTLDDGSRTLTFYRGSPTAFAAARAIPVAFELSIAGMAGCEVGQIVPRFLVAAPDAAQTRMLNVLGVLAIMLEQSNHVRALEAPGVDRSEAEQREARIARMRASLPAFIASFTRDSDPPLVEAFWEGAGKAVFDGDRADFDSALAAFGPGLDDAIAFFRHVSRNPDRISVEAFCADATLGFH